MNEKLRMMQMICVVMLTIVSSGFSQVTLLIESLPPATPETDTIYVSGNFNGWVPNDPSFAFSRQGDGLLAITVPTDRDTIQYKLTRGSWTRVETDRLNTYTENRVWVAGDPQHIRLSVENWLDLGGARRPGFLVFYFFGCAFQGLILIAMARMRTSRPGRRFYAFAGITVLLMLAMALLVLNELSVNWLRFHRLTTWLGLFLWLPLVRIAWELSVGGKVSGNRIVLFLPFLLVLSVVVFKSSGIPVVTFILEPVFHSPSAGGFIMLGTALVANGFFIAGMRKHFQYNPNDTGPLRRMYHYLFVMIIASLVVTTAAFALPGQGFRSFDVSGVVLSTCVWILTFYSSRYGDLLKEDRVAGRENIFDEMVVRLRQLMDATRIYRKPDLSLHELAEHLGVKPHVLSRMLNEHCQQSFRDFVNAYRVADFVEQVNSGAHRQYTFFALAQEVGFNSKSTFNTAFRKVTGESPRNYFRKPSAVETAG